MTYFVIRKYKSFNQFKLPDEKTLLKKTVMKECKVRTYLKLYGPALLKAIPILEGIAKSQEDISGSPAMKDNLKEQTINNIKSSSIIIGNYDFSFDWHEDPTIQRVLELIRMLDGQLYAINVRYEISTVNIGEEDQERLIDTGYPVSYIKLVGPGIGSGLLKLSEIDSPKIDSHGLAMGFFDYFYAWNKIPSNEEILSLIANIENKLSEITNYSVLYNISTKDSKRKKKKDKFINLKHLQVIQDRTSRFDKARFDLRRFT